MGTIILAGTFWAWNTFSLVLMITVIRATNDSWYPAVLSLLYEHYPENRSFALYVRVQGANLGDAIVLLFIGVILCSLSWQCTASYFNFSSHCINITDLDDS